MIQLTLTLKVTTAQVVETSVTVNNNRPIQDYVHSDDQTQPTIKFTLLSQEHWTYDPFSAHKTQNGDIYARGTQVCKLH